MCGFMSGLSILFHWSICFESFMAIISNKLSLSVSKFADMNSSRKMWIFFNILVNNKGISTLYYYFYYKWKIVAILCRSSLSIPFFSNSICSLRVSVLHFANSCNISNVFIIIFVIVICHQWSLMSLLQLSWQFLALKYF